MAGIGKGDEIVQGWDLGQLGEGTERGTQREKGGWGITVGGGCGNFGLPRKGGSSPLPPHSCVFPAVC